MILCTLINFLKLLLFTTLVDGYKVYKEVWTSYYSKLSAVSSRDLLCMCLSSKEDERRMALLCSDSSDTFDTSEFLPLFPVGCGEAHEIPFSCWLDTFQLLLSRGTAFTAVFDIIGSSVMLTSITLFIAWEQKKPNLFALNKIFLWWRLSFQWVPAALHPEDRTLDLGDVSSDMVFEDICSLLIFWKS